MKLSANLNFLFTEGGKPLSERIFMAHGAGFNAVEIPFPNFELEDVLQAKESTGIQIALINISLGKFSPIKNLFFSFQYLIIFI